jgi:hypothetical protein
MASFLIFGCPNWAGSRRPLTIAPDVRRDGVNATLIAFDADGVRLRLVIAGGAP